MIPLRDPVEWEDFIYVESKSAVNIPIKILTGPFQDVIFCYGAVRFEPTTNSLRVKFDFEVLEPDALKKKLGKSSEFKEYISKILNTVITKEVLDEDRESSYEVLDQESRLR